ncbi:formate/nitrite transporter family protein [Cohnella rhizosphaerae]|uniref:Formate/nitrite transporter family protein n=1 Tax=Cohnella rhizosphaerae TaxID=1457232 RepID=A0A9X4QR85_9BACL|nr:formate/nitrite transporter family protein [Cohnella rhizosphaerae]MDG0807988.1 formate/nitrite transporter family protein [Cohnella rhizosphaerae]
MDFVKPRDVLKAMIEGGAAKAEMSASQMLIRGFLGGAILAFATTLAFTAVAQTKIGMAGAVIFPVGFVMIVLLGLELVTGSFALIPPKRAAKENDRGQDAQKIMAGSSRDI